MLKGKVVEPELSYRIVGLAFKMFNDIGYGMSEKYYQRVFAKILEREKIPFKKEHYVKLSYNGDSIGSYFLDFVVDDKIVVELKVRPHLGYVHIKQVVGYLRATKQELAILIYITRDGIKYRRVVNIIK